jgi:hypothetical protein
MIQGDISRCLDEIPHLLIIKIPVNNINYEKILRFGVCLNQIILI